MNGNGGALLLTVPQAAKLLGLPLRTVYHLATQGVLRPLKLGRRVYFRRDDLLRDLDRLHGHAESENASSVLTLQG